MKKTRLIAMVVTLVFTLSLFMGIGTMAAVKKAKTVTLKLWGGVPAQYGPLEVVANFNKEFKDKGIQLEYTRFVNDDPGNLKLDMNLLSGGDIDLFMTYNIDYLKKRASGKMALDLGSFIAKDKYDMVKNYGEIVKNYYIENKVYACPAQLANAGILINKDMFDAAKIKVPTSWTIDEFKAIAKKLTKGEGQNKVYGMYFNSVQDIKIAAGFVQTALGGDLYYKAGGKESNFDSPYFEKNLQVVSDMMNVDKSAVSHIDTLTQKLTIEGMFLSGKAAMSVGTWITRSIKDLKNYPHNFKTALAPYPIIDKASAKYSAGGLGDFLSINTKSQYTAEAWEFIKWYNSKGSLPMTKYGRVPASKTFFNAGILWAATKGSEKVLDAKSFDAVMVRSFPKYAVPSITNKLPEISKVVNEEYEAAITQQKTPKEAMASAKKRADALLK